MNDVLSENQKRISRTKTVTEQLRAHIKENHLVPGDALPREKDLCNQFKASRTVVREALATLKADGLVIARHGVGFFVAAPDQNKIQSPTSFDLGNLQEVSAVLDVLELRKGVEAEAAALAALRRSPAQEAHIFGCLDQLKKALEIEELDSSQPDHEFHRAIAKATNNPVYENFLDYIIRTAMAQAFEIGYGANEARRLDRIDILLDEHRKIADAISAQDSEQARHAMEEHLDQSAKRFRQISYQS